MKANYDYDVEMPEEYDLSKMVGVMGAFTEWNAEIKKNGKYYTRVFDYENNQVTISEIQAGTHEVLSEKVWDLADYMPL
ncbi:MAG: hypothetical protein FWG68_07985 [Defluviitaleaceae bacterium]|nr:hypothetical protein [Defluviitaleaceae bacterium]